MEDDTGLQKQMCWGLPGIDVLVAGDRKSAIEIIKSRMPPVVTLDLGLPPDTDGAGEGLAALTEILRLAPYTKVIMVTGNDDRKHALSAIGKGAYDFYIKPINIEELRFIIDRAFLLAELEKENRELIEKQSTSPLPGLIAASQEMLQICSMIEKSALSDISVLVQGETGTGKELLVRALHSLSPRRSEKFVAINCAAIPDTLLESELFGYEKGAFTGATRKTAGRIERADKGTLFLDEVGDLPLALQAKLLRFLQERVVERLGGGSEISVDVRIVAATHQNLPDLIKSGRFREDLYYRLSQMVIDVPPLRERPGDAAAIASALFRGIAAELHKPKMKLSSGALLAIENYPWPGNIRELENKLKQVAVIADKDVIEAEDMKLPDPDGKTDSFSLAAVRGKAERQAVGKALAFSGGNVSKAAEMLKVSRPTLYDLISKYNIR